MAERAYPKYGNEKRAQAVKSRAKLISITHKPKLIGGLHIPGYAPKTVIRTSMKVRKVNKKFKEVVEKCKGQDLEGFLVCVSEGMKGVTA